MKNYAGHSDKDDAIAAELEAAGIEVVRLPECMRASAGEVATIVIGSLHGWSFKRAWYYWVAEGPGLPPVYANELHVALGREVRVDGHCGCPSPLEWLKGFAVGSYHVDTQEGLNALAAMLNRVVKEAND